MNFDLKKLSPQAVPAALERAQTYRLLNEPTAAESICRDVMAIEPDNQEALIELLLSLTDQFRLGKPGYVKEAESIAERLASQYHRDYYRGLVFERRAMVHLESRPPGYGFTVYDWLRDAMHYYEAAQNNRPPNNDESLLRWNTCARVIMSHPEIRDQDEEGESKEIHLFDA